MFKKLRVHTKSDPRRSSKFLALRPIPASFVNMGKKIQDEQLRSLNGFLRFRQKATDFIVQLPDVTRIRPSFRIYTRYLGLE